MSICDITEQQFLDGLKFTVNKNLIKNIVKKEYEPKKFDARELQSDDNLVEGVLKSNEDAKSKASSIMGNSFKKLRTIFKMNSDEKKVAESFIDDIKDGSDGKINERMIAMHQIIETVQGEHNKIEKYNIKENDVGKLKAEGTVMNIPLGRIASAIGRKTLYVKGIRIKSTRENRITPKQVEALYYREGKRILSELESLGFISLNKGYFVNDMVAPMPNSISDNVAEFEAATKVPANSSNNKIKEGSVVLLNLNKLVGSNDNEMSKYNEAFFNDHSLLSQLRKDRAGKSTKAESIDIISSVARAANMMLIEPNLKLPNTNVDVHSLGDKDYSGLTETQEYVREELYKRPVKINKTAKRFLSSLAKDYNESGKSIEDFLSDKSENDKKAIMNIFGINSIPDFNVDQKESKFGQNLSKLTPIEDILINFDQLSDADLHMKYFFARNGRMHEDVSVLAAQADKFSRHALTTGEYTIDINKNDKEFKHILVHLADELGVAYEEITDISKFKKAEEELNGMDRKGLITFIPKTFEQKVAFYKKFKDNDSNLLAIANRLNEGYSQPITATFGQLQAVLDIREGITGDGTFKSEFMTKPDATASGGVFSFLAAMGYNSKQVLEVVSNLGLVGSNKEIQESDALRDVYAIMEKGIKEKLGDDGTNTDNIVLPVSTKPNKNIDTIKDLLDPKMKLYKDMRDLSKDPSMVFIYGQGAAGGRRTISENIADRLLNNLDNHNVGEFINRLLPNAKLLDPKDAKIRPGLRKDLISELGSKHGVANELIKILDSKITSILKVQKSAREEVYSHLIKSHNGKRIKMLPAIAKMEDIETTPDNIKELGIPLMKVRNVINEFGNNGEHIVTMEDRPTVTTLQVNTIHTMDAASLVLTAGKVLPNEKTGMLGVHDEAIGNPFFNVKFEKEYVNTVRDVVTKYDPIGEALETIKVMNREYYDNNVPQKLKDTIEEASKTRKEIMSKYGDKGEPSKIFGIDSKNVNIDGLVKENKETVDNDKDNSKNKNKLGIDSGLFNVASKLGIEIKESKEGRYSVKDGKETISGDTKTKIEHELYHAIVGGYLLSGTKTNAIKYVDTVIKRLREADISNFSSENRDRLNHILSQKNSANKVNEFIAIFKTESSFRGAIQTHFIKKDKNNVAKILTRKIEEIIKKAFQSITGKQLEDAKGGDVDIEVLQESIDNIISSGYSFRTENETLHKQLVEENGDMFFTDGSGKYIPNSDRLDDKISRPIESINESLKVLLVDNMEKTGIKTLEAADRILLDKFPMYSDVRNIVVGLLEKTSLKQIAHYTKLSKFKSKEHKNKILSMMAEIHSNRNTTESNDISNFDHLTKKWNDDEKEIMFDLVSKVSLADFFKYSNAKDQKEISSRIYELEKSLSKNEIELVKSMVSINVDGIVINPSYGQNLSFTIDHNSKRYKKIKELIALKSIDKIGSEDALRVLNKDDKVLELIKDHSLSLSTLSDSIDGFDKNTRDTLVRNNYEKQFETKIITANEYRKFGYEEETGWKILKKPVGSSEIGIVYRITEDSFYTEGAGVDIRTISNDIVVPDRIISKLDGDIKGNNIVRTKDGHKLILTNEQKETLGLIKHAGHSLIRSSAHMMAVKESQEVRDMLLAQETRSVVNSIESQELKDVQTKIKSENVDHPWFIKLGSDVNYIDLPEDVKKEYKPIQSKLSNIKGFDKEVSLVRKDIAYWLVGSKNKGFFTNRTMQKISRVAKQLVSTAKINMVILNPKKIALDAASNVNYLITMGVPTTKILQYSDIIDIHSSSLNKYRDRVIKLKLKSSANPKDSNIQNQLNKAIKSYKTHPVYFLTRLGFSNSISSDIINNNIDTISGLQADVDKGLNYLMTKKDGKTPNAINKFIMEMAKTGFNGEDFLRVIGKTVGNAGGLKNAENALNAIADRITQLKTDEDTVGYITQFIVAPNSEAVKAGMALNDKIDATSKAIYLMHLMDKGKSEEEALVEVINAFPDFKESMPMSLKIPSDYAVLMFPSFWARMQQTIYRMGKAKTLTLLGEYEIGNYLDIHLESIVDANILNKATSFGGILHSPGESIGMGSVVPTNIFKNW